MLQPSVKVMQNTRHSNGNPESLFPLEGIIVVSAVELFAEVSIEDAGGLGSSVDDQDNIQ